MTFENPGGLWLLALGIPILAFHFYRGRLRKMQVPTLLFWEQVLVEEERRTALRRLRHYASLLFNLAALFVLTSAVAGPQVRRPARYALVLDNTPSLGAREAGGGTRMDAAVRRAREFAGSLAHGDPVSIHDFGGARAPFSTDHEAVIRRLNAPPPASRGDARERLRAALAPGEDVTAILFTDRVPPGVEDLLASGRLRLARVGGPRDNTGWISGLAIRKAGEKRVTLSLGLASLAAAAVERDEVLLWNGRELARRRASLAAGERATREWRLDPARFPGARLEEGGLAQAVLEPADDFPLDDRASFVVPPLVPPSVLVFHPGTPDPLLMANLETLKGGGSVAQEIGEAPVERYASVRARLGEGWIAIFDRVAPPGPLGGGGSLILGAPGDRVRHPTLADWDREAPPNHLVDYSGLSLRSSRILQGTPLLRAVEGPVAVFRSGGGRAEVELGFSLAESDIAARPTFLHLLLNFVDWAGWRGTRSFRTEYRVGEPLAPVHPLWVGEGEILFAADERVDRAVVRRGRIESAPPAAPGFVRVSAADRSEWVAVNLFDEEESDLRERPPTAAGAPLPPPAPWHARIPYAALAGAAVLAILIVEAWLFHRGLI